MASVNRSARSATKSRQGFSFGVAIGALLSVGVVAGSAWGLASTLGVMQDAARSLSQGTLHLQVAVAEGYRPETVPKAIKSSRYLKASESEIRQSQLTAEAIQLAHQRRVATELALAEKRQKEEETRILAFAAPVKPIAPPAETMTVTPSLVSALVEDVSPRNLEPFDLVLADGETDEPLALPGEVPLPEARPEMKAVRVDPKPAVEKPVLRKSLNNTEPAEIERPTAIEKPQRTLFGSLFGSKNTGGAWSGNNRKVAIYDVSNATVYLPDGTKLRAHSGIGIMRDNPRYEHVKMRGPTPAGIYRLSMREKRFYGVEAIRMTSIDGRDPKNRTGLLTHTNLLRGQKGSHGCVAFQDYEPFLRAFKRGQITTMVVVPELPSSPTQLAALYRKAGA